MMLRKEDLAIVCRIGGNIFGSEVLRVDLECAFVFRTDPLTTSSVISSEL